MKSSTLGLIIVMDILFVGAAFAVSATQSLYSPKLFDFGLSYNQVTNYPNGTQVDSGIYSSVPPPRELIAGLWIMFIGLVAGFDLFIYKAPGIDMSFNNIINRRNRRIVVNVEHKMSEQEIIETGALLVLRLRNISNGIELQEKTGQANNSNGGETK
jgi:hypothetical protein